MRGTVARLMRKARAHFEFAPSQYRRLKELWTQTPRPLRALKREEYERELGIRQVEEDYIPIIPKVPMVTEKGRV